MSHLTLHHSVLLQESIEALAIKPNGFYIDGTFGRGGHTAAILAGLNQDGRVLAIDKDPQAIAYGHTKFTDEPRLVFMQGSFASLLDLKTELNVDGILLDLGVSSPQLDQAERGFSFMQDGPLDMRMDNHQGLTAAEWINTASADTMADIFFRYGEERFSRRIAAAIVTARQEKKFTRTLELAELIKAAHPHWEKHKHPATRCFQAIRIFLNNELGDLENGLIAAVKRLKSGGRLAVISFHSLEDRIVKQFFLDQSRAKPLPRGIPIEPSLTHLTLKLIGKPIKASETELADNIRSRSAILRIAERL